MSTDSTVDLVLHPFDDAGLVFLGGVQGHIDLPGRSLMFALQAALSQATLQAVFFIALKLHEQVVTDACTLGLEP